MARPAKKRAADSDEEATDYSDSPGPSSKNKKNATQKSQKAKKGRGRPKKKNPDDDDSDDVDEDDSDEDGVQGGKGKKVELNDTEKKEHIQAIVRYVLFNETHRRVIKRDDIVKNVLTDGRGRHFAALMPKVQKLLKDIMGMELILLRARETSAGKSTPKAWMLRSTIPQPLLRHAAITTSSHYATQLPFEHHASNSKGRKSLKEELGDWMIDESHLDTSKKKEVDSDDEEEEEEEDEEVEGGVMRDAKREEGSAYGVLGTILALILVNGKVLGDDQLISYLRRLNLMPGTSIPLTLSSPHPESITLAAYLTLLTKQQYLERTKTAGGGGAGGATQTQGAGRSQAPSRTQRATAEGIQESGDPSVEWRWGARAEAELGEEGVARFVQFIFENGNKEKGSQGAGKRGKTGEKFLVEIARAAGAKKLQRAEQVEGGGFN
ncbi:hypothetical protein JCM16303_000794 [Sporobolomyces ruberrimus]